MSVFAPLDVRSPDQRRKQLLMRLAQGGRAGLVAEGSPSRRAAAFRGIPRPQSTHAPNILASILAKLGVSGGPQAGEFSPGPGMAINPHIHPGGPPPEVGGGGLGGIPIPTHGADPSGGDRLGSEPPLPGGVSGGGIPSAAGGYGLPPAPDTRGTDGAAGPSGPVPYDTRGTAGAAGPGGPAAGGLIPLGNGLYYDPVTDRVVGGGAGAGSQARAI
jgi:hypothetical protein